jgi:hypothetical protein
VEPDSNIEKPLNRKIQGLFCGRGFLFQKKKADLSIQQIGPFQ